MFEILFFQIKVPFYGKPGYTKNDTLNECFQISYVVFNYFFVLWVIGEMHEPFQMAIYKENLCRFVNSIFMAVFKFY